MEVAVSERECVRARLALSLALDGEAAGTDLYRTALHVGGCDSCREFVAQVASITAQLRALGGRTPGAGIAYAKGVRE